MLDETDRSPLLVRLPLELKALVAYRAKENHRSMAAEVAAILRTTMSAEPPYAVVHECNFDGDKFFTATLGESFDDFYEGPSKEAAITAARTKMKQLGFDARNIVFRENAARPQPSNCKEYRP